MPKPPAKRGGPNSSSKAWMTFGKDAEHRILFLLGCLGMVTFGLVLPLAGEGFNAGLFAAWSALALAGEVGGR